MPNPPAPVLNWLLEEEYPSLRVRTQCELLDMDPADPEVRRVSAAIPDSKPVRDVLEKMTPSGTWLEKKSGTGKLIGDGVEYGSYATTHFRLAYLAELGLNRSHPAVALAAERYLSLQDADGDWNWDGNSEIISGHLSCLTGYNLRTFTLLGYRDDPRLQRVLDLLLKMDRPDGGYLCDMHPDKRKSRPNKSCFRGSDKVLLAFSEYPAVWQHPRCLALLEYFLARGGIYRSTEPGVYVTRDLGGLSFPITWGANSYEVLLALARMGRAKDPRLAPAWEDLLRRADEDGFYSLSHTPSACPWKVGRKGERNKWVTFYAWLARKEWG